MDDKKEDTGEERLPYCTTAPSAEHARAHNEDEPCDDGTGGGKPWSPGTIDKELLCDRIRAIYPQIGQCGIDLKAKWDNDRKVWIIDFKSGEHALTTYLETGDAEACMDGRQCPALGDKIDDLKAAIMKA